jgi:hypothetical protein
MKWNVFLIRFEEMDIFGSCEMKRGQVRLKIYLLWMSFVNYGICSIMEYFGESAASDLRSMWPSD